MLIKKLTYDHRNRLLSETSTLNSGTPAVVNYSYNDLGQLTGKKYGNLAETLSHNIRVWITAKSSPHFTSFTTYNIANTVRYYNDNIGEWLWGYGSTSNYAYTFDYDALSRLTGSQWFTNINADLGKEAADKGIGYDKNEKLGVKNTRPAFNLYHKQALTDAPDS